MAAQPQKKKKNTAKRPAAKGKGSAAKARQAAQGRRQMWAVILFFVAVLLFLLAVIQGEKAWLAMHDAYLGLFGICGYIWPILLGYVAIASALERPTVRISSRVIMASSIILLLGGTIDLFTHHLTAFSEHLLVSFEIGSQPRGGGLFGALIGWPVRELFDVVGGAIILILIQIVLFMLLTGTTLIQLLRTLSKPAQSIKETTQEAYIRRQQMEEERKKSFDVSLEGMPDVPPGVKNRKQEDLETKKNRLLRTYQGKDEEPSEFLQEELTDEAQQNAEMEDIIRRLQEQEKPIETVPSPIVEQEQEVISPQIVPEEEVSRPVSEIVEEEKVKPEYRFPPLSLLQQGGHNSGMDSSDELKANAERLVDTLRSFGVETRIINISRGPAVTRYELQPSAGVKISKITNLADDIALNLATAGVRIEAPIPNKAAVGIEVPNKKTGMVHVRDVLETPLFAQAKSKLTVALGKDIAGNPAVADLAKMPHLLIAGATGSGKSVCINTFIISLLYKAAPEDVKLLMIDPKVVELGIYNGIPHLLVPVVTDPRKAAGALGWAVTEMLHRYQIFAECNVRDLVSYNRMAEKSDKHQPMPQIVIIIDELADLMMVAPSEVEDSICRLAQMARAAGMHLVIATQRPSVDVITGIIKANIPSRIAFAVANQFDSRTILDTGGAEKLLGKGDMLYSPVGAAKSTRIQGCFVSDQEIENVLEFIRKSGETEYNDEVMEGIEQHIVPEKGSKKKNMQDDGSDDDAGDEMLPQAIECVVEAGAASTTMLQRRLKLGYARAARIVDELEERGIVGPFEGSKPRKVLITKQQWLERKNAGDDL